MRARRALVPLLMLGLCGVCGFIADAEEPTRPLLAPSVVPTDLEDARLFNAVAGTIRHDLKLPLSWLSVEVVDSTTFVQILATWSRRPDLAREAREANAVALGGRLLVRADVLSGMPALERARLYAHELAHLSVAQMRPGGNSVAWISEGHADWVAFRVLDRLGYRSHAHSRAEVWRRFRGVRIDRLPALTDLETNEAWIRAAAGTGWVATYGQASLAVDRLVERYTADTLREFFRRSPPPRARLELLDARGGFGNLLLWQRDWDAVFPVTYPDFVAEFRAHLETPR